jgi:hypothetical protein
MQREEFRDRRREVAHAEVHRGGKPDGAARRYRRARGFLLGFFQIGEKLHRALVERPAALGQAHAPRCAIEKPGLQVRLEFRHVS